MTGRIFNLTFRSYLILLLIIVANPEALSQLISVKSFRQLTNDLDARVHYPKEDKNGEKAALVKVVTTETGFEFEGGSIGLVATENKTGEIWVYVPRGARVLTIKHSRLGVLRNQEYPEPIESGVVYEMVLVTGKVDISVTPPEIETQWLVITSEPSGADLYLNDNAAGKTPYQSELPVGRYTWRLSRELYLPEAGVAELISGSNRKVITIPLKPDFGTVTVTTVPESGATVSLDNMPTGKTSPCKLDMVKSGDHTLTLSLDMYETTTHRFSISAGEQKTLEVPMNPTFAEVKLSSEPPGDIYINETKKGTGTWQGRLNPGVYTFEAKLDKHRPAMRKSTVAVGTPLNVALKPEPITGTLRIITNPFDATVKLNGKEVGKTPLTLKDLLIGDYTAEITLAGHATATEKVTIADGQASEISTALQSGMMVEVEGTAGAALFIDGKPAGNLPYSGSLTFGTHRLRIEKEGKKQEKEVEIKPGGIARFTLTISANYTEETAGLDMEMVFVEGGTFSMGSNQGSDDEKPVHRVRVDDFYLGKTEVTQRQWRAVMRNNPSHFKNCDQCPVEQVSWNDIQDFIKKLNNMTGKKYRLPTEAEWEYAARGGSKGRGYTYSGSDNLEEVAWYNGNSGSKTHPVGQKKSNEQGLSDMSGNVWEWCHDWYGSDYYKNSPADNPKGPSSGAFRVIRGGSWYLYADYCRSARRINNGPGYRNGNLGFRLVFIP